MGGVTTGGFDVIKGGYSPSSQQKSGKYELHFKGGFFGDSGIIEIIEYKGEIDKNNNSIMKFLNNTQTIKYPSNEKNKRTGKPKMRSYKKYTFTLENKNVKNKLSDYEKEQLMIATRANDFQTMSALTKDYIIDKKLNYEDCNNIKSWICGKD